MSLAGNDEIAKDNKILHQLTASIPTDGGTLATARGVLRRLHGEIFTGAFDPNCSGVHEMLSTGNFNCVTASVMFLAAAERLEIPGQAVLVPGHLRCRIWCAENASWCDIEPTLASGVVPATTTSSRQTGRQLDAVQTLAKLYFNRSLIALDRSCFARAMGDARLAWQLDPAHAAASENLRTIWNNWALASCQRGNFREALSLLEEARCQFPDDPLLQANELHVYLCWLEHHLHDRDRMGFQAVLQQATDRYPAAGVFQDLRAFGR